MVLISNAPAPTKGSIRRPTCCSSNWLSVAFLVREPSLICEASVVDQAAALAHGHADVALVDAPQAAYDNAGKL